MGYDFHGKNIIFIFHGSELGGAERQGLMYAKYLKDSHGARVQIWGLGANKAGRVSELCEDIGIVWHGVPFVWSVNNLVRIKELIKFIVRLVKEKPDILLPYTRIPNIVSAFAWRFSNAKICCWNQRDEGRGLTTSFWHRSAVKLASHYVSNSTIGKEALLNLYQVPDSFIQVIYNGVLLSSPVVSRSVWRKILGIPQKCFVATMVANLHEYKDHKTLLYAWHNVMNRIQEGIMFTPVLLLAGRFADNSVQDLKLIVRDLNIESNVIFLGKVDDITGLLMASDLCVHSSKHEGLPNAVLEAMAAALPIVASDIPGIREAVGPNNYKYLSKIGNCCDLADKITLFIMDKNLCKKIGQMNKFIANKKFSHNKMCQKMTNYLGS